MNNTITKIIGIIKKNPVQLISIIIIISLAVWYILSFFQKPAPTPGKVGPLCNISGKDDTTRCNPDQTCHTCGTNLPQCGDTCSSDKKYYCSLHKCDKICNDDEYSYTNDICGLTGDNNVQCISKPSSIFGTNGGEYPALVSDGGNKCQWLSGFKDTECKLTDKNDSTGVLYSDCLNILKNSPYSINQNLVLNNTFKCGYINGDNIAGGKFAVIPDPTKDGLLKNSNNPLSPIYKCDPYPEILPKNNNNKSNFTPITDSNTWKKIGISSNKKLLPPGSTQNTNDICDVNINGNQITGYKQIIDCGSSTGTINQSWVNYYSSLNCTADGTNSGSGTCEVPCWMFDTVNPKSDGQGSVCDNTTPTCKVSGGFPPACLYTSDECDPYTYSYDLLQKSCNNDTNGCVTVLDTDGKSIVAPAFDGKNCNYVYSDGTKSTSSPIDKGCRIPGTKWLWDGLYCKTQPETYNYITITKISIDNQSPNYYISNLEFTITDNKDGNYNTFFRKFYSYLQNYSAILTNLKSLIYKIGDDNKIVLSSQVYSFSNTKNLIFSYSPWDPTSPLPEVFTFSIKPQSGNNMISLSQSLPTDTTKFTSYNDITTGSTLFCGISLIMSSSADSAITLNSVEINKENNLQNIDMSNSTNLFKK